MNTLFRWGALAVACCLVGLLACDVRVAVSGSSSSSANYFARSYGGSNSDTFLDVHQTSGGGYIVAGYTRSFGAGQADAWVMKLTSDGDVDWQRAYGGSSNDRAHDIYQLSSGDFVFTGFTESFGEGKSDVWVVKLTNNGSVTWEKTYGSPKNESGFAIEETGGGDLIVGGITTGLGASGVEDGWVLRLQSDGSIDWQNRYGDGSGNEKERVNQIRPIGGGGFIATGRLDSAGTGGGELWGLKLAGDGTINENKIFGTAHDDRGLSIAETSSPSGFVVCGEVAFSSSNPNGWILHLDSSLNINWERAYGAGDREGLFSVRRTSDGGYIASGFTTSQSDNSETAGGGEELWLLKLTAGGSGAMDWQRAYGGSDDELGVAVRQLSNDEFIVVGQTGSYGKGGFDAWVAQPLNGGKMDPLGTDTSQTSAAVSPAVNSVSNNRTSTSGVVNTSSATVTTTAAAVFQQAP